MKTSISALFALSILVGIASPGALASARANHWQATRIVVHLYDEASIVVRRTSLEAKKNGLTWRGEIDETHEPVMIMWWQDGRFSGLFTYHSDMYTLKTVTKIDTEVESNGEHFDHLYRINADLDRAEALAPRPRVPCRDAQQARCLRLPV
jgi:hypothetical protein